MAHDGYLYDVEDIKGILPHRYPFLLLDRVIEVTPGRDGEKRVGRSAKCLKNVTINEPFFEGHFPGRPIMPGVLIIEAMAQAGALACFRDGDNNFDIVIASISDAKFRRPIVPGDSVILSCEVLKDRGRMILLGCQALVGDEIAAEAKIMAHVVFKN